MGKAKDKTVVAGSSSGVVVGGGRSRWHIGPRLRVVLMVAVIVVVAGGAGVGLRWWQQSRDPENRLPGANAKPTVAQQAQRAALDGQPEASQKIISDELKKSGLSADEKYQLYYQQGATYQNGGDNKSALESYKKAAAAKATQGVYESLGAVSVLLGDKPGAIAYYQKAIQLATGPLADDDRAADEQIIKDLGGQP